MAVWWGRQPNGVVEDDRCDLGAALFCLEEGDPLEVTCDPDPGTHILSIHMNGALKNQFRADGITRFEGDNQVADVVIIPAGQRPVALLREARTADVMHLYIPDRIVRRACADMTADNGPLEIKDHFASGDQEALRAARLVRDEMRNPGIASSLLLDSVAAAMAVRIIRHWSNLGETPPALRRGGLAPWQVRKAQQIVQDRLAEEVRLEELAAAVGLSTFHFARAFRQSTGVPPHRYQTLTRLERARDMLAKTDLGVLHIAIAIGYESGQALARAFRREYGCSPAEFRREMCR